MARLRAPAVPRHRPPGAEWWTLTLPELEALVDRGDHEAAYRLSRGLLEDLDGRRGCGPRHGPPGATCAACQAVDRAWERVIQLQARARLNAPLSWTPPTDDGGIHP